MGLVAPITQAVVVPEVPSLQEEGANCQEGPSLEEGGPNLEVADPSWDEGLCDAWKDVLDQNS